MASSELARMCITDVGSTTTKAILFRRTGNGDWEYFRREAPTTVEKPDEDVSIGVMEALRALEQESGEILLKDGALAVTYLSTSSAGGGLAMVVTGLVRNLTAETADRVALGAGAIVLDVICMNDGRTAYHQIED
ncbi:MAG: glutamate mutase L, partial [Candidatus Eisenbacteria sp.]|nr:glutamate mutase L [Candidatus Eisenbacteria bacterium]